MDIRDRPMYLHWDRLCPVRWVSSPHENVLDSMHKTKQCTDTRHILVRSSLRNVSCHSICLFEGSQVRRRRTMSSSPWSVATINRLNLSSPYHLDTLRYSMAFGSSSSRLWNSADNHVEPTDRADQEHFHIQRDHRSNKSRPRFDRRDF